jgi:hypothetical protein
MDDAFAVGIFQRLADFVCELERGLVPSPMVGRLLDQALDIAATHELGDEVRPASSPMS